MIKEKKEAEACTHSHENVETILIENKYQKNKKDKRKLSPSNIK